jgi:hypothetical protein
MGGVCIVLELDRAFEIIFEKLLDEMEYEFLRHLKYLFEIKERERNRKKACRGQGLALVSRLDPSIPRSSNSFGCGQLA